MIRLTWLGSVTVDPVFLTEEFLVVFRVLVASRLATISTVGAMRSLLMGLEALEAEAVLSLGEHLHYHQSLAFCFFSARR